MNSKSVLELHHITKTFGTFTANENISLSLLNGEVHAILGENGAGKSTLMNIISGLIQPTSGEIILHGKRVKFKNAKDAISQGIGMVHQHFMLIEPFTVAENIILGSEPNKMGVLDIQSAIQQVSSLASQYGLDINPHSLVQNISIGMQQRVEILKVLYRGANIIIFDEPTAVLTPQEIEDFGTIVKNLAQQGKSIFLITHKLKEIKKIANRCSVLRRGKLISTLNVPNVSEKDLSKEMIGRDLSPQLNRKQITNTKTLLRIENLTIHNNRQFPIVKNLNLEIQKGEILGLAGIDGNGQSELIEALTGLRKIESGQIYLNDKNITNLHPHEIISLGIAMIPDDRHKRGLLLPLSINENLILKNHFNPPFTKHGLLSHSTIQNWAQELINRYDIRPTNPSTSVSALSGGNQQKVIIARELSDKPELLIAAQPTRGLDVGAIEFVHKSLLELKEAGKTILLVSFELEEIINLSDRIAVIYNGEIKETLSSSEASESRLGLSMVGGTRA